MIRTRFTELLGLEYPIMSAPMALHSGGTLAAAVSETGALGSFGGIGPGGPPWLRDEIARVRDRTDRPFAVGFITAFLPMMTEMFDVALEAGVDVIALSFGSVGPWLARAQDAGAKVICQVQTIEWLHDARDAGADAIAVQGNEAGGHTGPLGLLPFLTHALELGGDVPVLAAGGIGNARALAAVLAAGADGGWIGTPFLATPEAVEVPDGYKQLIVESDGQDTMYGTLFDRLSGAPWPDPVGVRMRRNRFLTEWEGRDADALARREELAAQWAPPGGAEFDAERTPVFYGPSAASVQSVVHAADVVRSLAAGAEQRLHEVSKTFSPAT